MLDTLEPRARWRIAAHLQPVDFKSGAVLCEVGAQLDYAYFPAGSVLSLLTLLENGSSIETANIGSEGAFGLFAVLSSLGSFVRCVIQLPGPLVRCPIGVLRNEAEHSADMRDLCGVASDSIFTQVQQNMVCNAHHTAPERLSRWLLTMCDRSAGQCLAYPNALFANILGESGHSVALAAQGMHNGGIITYRHGTLQVVDRPALEKASCNCYMAVKKRLAAGALPT